MHFCVSCGNIITTGGANYSNGRYVCAKCDSAVVKTQQHVDWVNARVLPILSKYGITDIPKGIDIKVVTSAELARIQNSSQVNLLQMGLTRTAVAINFFGKSMSHEIFMVDGQHKIMFAGTLAHEYLHVWQNERDIRLPSLYCEGFCNMGAYLVYRNIANELAHSLYTRMRDGNDAIYCEGFRQVKAVFDGEGEKNMIKTMDILIKTIH